MTRKRSEQSSLAEEARLHKPSTQIILHRFVIRKSDFYRYARHVHAWLSAFAFLSLIFFAGTGLFLNNTDWFASKPEQVNLQINIPAEVLAQAKTIENPAPLLLDAIRKAALPHVLSGAFKSSDLVDGELNMRLAGAKGQTDITVALETGRAEITVKPASVLSTLKNLHKGRNVGSIWKLVIDISAILILILSIAGYLLFFSLRKRKAISLWLTGLCFVTLVSVFIWGVV
ncbi:MAG: PepSY-associated TM helix domain-containing protein [Aquirhabdus sp.]